MCYKHKQKRLKLKSKHFWLSFLVNCWLYMN